LVIAAINSGANTSRLVPQVECHHGRSDGHSTDGIPP